MKEEDFYTDHTISVVVEDHPGVLSKITSLITRRGFNIDSISAGPAKEKNMFRLTIIVKGDDRGIEQIQKQLYKMVDTVKVASINPNHKVEREIGLIKIKAVNGEKQEILTLVEVFKGTILDSSSQGLLVEIVGTDEKINSFISHFSSNKIVEIARTGIVAMNRWERS